LMVLGLPVTVFHPALFLHGISLNLAVNGDVSSVIHCPGRQQQP